MLQWNYLHNIFLFYFSMKFGNGLEYLKYFIKVQNCALKDSKTLMTLDVDTFNCSKNCFEASVCKSFVSRTMSPSCILYEDDSTEKILIDATNTHFYQLRRSVPTKFRDGRCPVDFVYNGYVLGTNDLGVTYGIHYMQCFYGCEAEPTCQSFDYTFHLKACYMSTHNHTNAGLRYLKGDVYTEINRISKGLRGSDIKHRSEALCLEMLVAQSINIIMRWMDRQGKLLGIWFGPHLQVEKHWKDQGDQLYSEISRAEVILERWSRGGECLQHYRHTLPPVFPLPLEFTRFTRHTIHLLSTTARWKTEHAVPDDEQSGAAVATSPEFDWRSPGGVVVSQTHFSAARLFGRVTIMQDQE
ncbi:uncharacterized protein LOC128249715 [Octopus bimaculoides]|nr:uncharacterized protein LOC128249715 [Octopus bimaculoides]